MMKHQDQFRLEHILECIEKIEYIVDKLKNYPAFEKKWIEQDAVIRNLEIIGEASVKISDSIKEQYPNVSWREMRGMRNFVTHQYFGVELDEIWATITNDIPILKTQIQNIIRDS